MIKLRMPSLRVLRADIPVLAHAILVRRARRAGIAPAPRLAPEAVRALQDYDFPGNVRELENILERAVALSAGGLIRVPDLQLTREDSPGDAGERGALPLQEHLDRVEREAILAALGRRATTAPRRQSCSGSPSARCATAWSALAFSSRAGALVLALAALAAGARAAERLPALGAAADRVTVSGISSGGYMAVQFHVAHSARVDGAGVFAGGPYLCAGGSAFKAKYNCMRPGSCRRR